MTTLILLPGMACDVAMWCHQQQPLAGPAGDLLLAGCSLGGMLALVVVDRLFKRPVSERRAGPRCPRGRSCRPLHALLEATAVR